MERREPVGSNEAGAHTRKTAISVLLALVTLTGAVFVWRSLVLGENAIDADRQAVFETAVVEQNRVNAEVAGEMDAVSAARHQALRAEEAALEDGARQSREAGLADVAESFERRLGDLRASSAVFGFDFDSDYLSRDESVLGLDVEAQVEAFLGESIDVARLDPDRSADEADGLHDQVVGISLLVAALVAVVFLLTEAWLVRRRRLQIALIGASAASYGALTVVGWLYAW